MTVLEDKEGRMTMQYDPHSYRRLRRLAVSCGAKNLERSLTELIIEMDERYQPLFWVLEMPTVPIMGLADAFRMLIDVDGIRTDVLIERLVHEDPANWGQWWLFCFFRIYQDRLNDGEVRAILRFADHVNERHIREMLKQRGRSLGLGPT